MRALRSRAGQIVLPAMLIFPTLMLFVWLIFETARLSKEKIRHQFAMDAAAFVEMANYSDFLNRTAYVNGAFPMRIFTEGYGDFKAECEGKVDNCPSGATYADMLYANGAFPRSATGKTAFTGDDHSWDIGYCSGGPAGSFPCEGGVAGKNEGPPTLKEPFELFTENNANQFWHPWDLATEVYKLYVQIYSLLGSVEDAQYSVLKRLSGDHSFMRKSYWLNTGDNVASADALVAAFRAQMPDFNSSSVARSICQRQIEYWGNKHGSGIQPYVPNTTGAIDLPTSQGCPQGLFQIMWVDQGAIHALHDGIPLLTAWSYPEKNFWNVDFRNVFQGGPPALHTRISLMGDPSNKPAVWPNPTPKFQVRQFP